MEKLVWKEEFNICLKEMDESREFLINHLGSLLAKIAEKPSANHIEALNELIDGFRIHFGKEEKLLVKYKYPEADIHKKEHKSCLRSLVKLRRQLSEEAIDENIELINIIIENYSTHLDESDPCYAPFIRLKKKIEFDNIKK
ncbi:MAG: hypothetical protein CSB21_03505 [Deltaproteobacteria bacterium]|nr:MAG: hypothetical protein CSB21_03505 [Deltaproteobacteria bacterium]